MFKTDVDEVWAVIYDDEGLLCGSILYEIGDDGALYDKDLFDDHLESKITFSSNNTKFTVTEYDDNEVLIADSYIAGTYTYKEAITMEKIVNKVIF